MKILFEGAFKISQENKAGGQLTQCLLIKEFLTDAGYNLLCVDTTADSPPPLLYVRIALAVKRFFLLFFHLVFNRPDAAIIFAADGLSFIEKGLHSIILSYFSKNVILFVRSGLIIKDFESKYFSVYAKIVFKNIDKLVVQSKYWCDYYSNYIDSKKLIVSHNIFTEKHDYLKISKSKKLLFVGWLSAGKGIPDLIALFKAKGTDFFDEFNFVGDGDCRKHLADYILQNSVTNIILNGWKSKQDLYLYYTNSSCLVLPTYYEGFPNVIIEALTFGLPVVTYEIEPITSIVPRNQEIVYYAKPGNIELLYSQILSSVENDNEDFRDKRKAFVQNTFSPEKNLKFLNELKYS